MDVDRYLPAMKKIFLNLLCSLSLVIGAKADIQPGDVVVVRIHTNTDGAADGFTWLALRDINAGVLKWTDAGWGRQYADDIPYDWWRNEDFVSNAFLEGPVAAGAMGEVFFNRPFPDYGDQLFLYSGFGPQHSRMVSNEEAGFVWGLQYGEDWLQYGKVAKDNRGSHEPHTLKTLGMSVALGEGSHWYYSGSTTGTVEQLLSRIRNPDNWSLADPAGTTWNDVRAEHFVIAVPEPSAIALGAGLTCLGIVLATHKRRKPTGPGPQS